MFIDSVQGNYNQGRGRDGLNGAAIGTRFGTSTRRALRPGHVGGQVNFAVNHNLPGAPVPKVARGPSTIFARVGGPAVNSAGLVTPRKPPGRIQTLRARRQFVSWLERWAPELHKTAKVKADMLEQSEGTLGSLSGWFDTFMDTLTNVGGKVLTLKQQKSILDAQMERMRQGLPPLQTSEYAPTVNVGVDPTITRDITGAIGAGFKSALPWLAVGAVALFFVLKPRRRGRG